MKREGSSAFPLFGPREPSFLDRLAAVKVNALAGKPAPTVADVIKTFQPSF